MKNHTTDIHKRIEDIVSNEVKQDFSALSFLPGIDGYGREYGPNEYDFFERWLKKYDEVAREFLNQGI